MTMRKFFAALAFSGVAALGLSAAASAAEGEATEPVEHEWDFTGPFGTFDRHQLQRGFQVYQEVCAACHSMRLLSYRNLGEPGGPFYDEEYPNPNDNPVVRSIAANYFMIDENPDEFGDPVERNGLPRDSFYSPYTNDQQARSANNGALPPDLSVIIHARGNGANYVYSLLTGYDADHEAPAGQYYNEYFPGGYLSMAPPLMDGRVEYVGDHAPEATVEQMSEDVVAFLAWAADPHMEERKQLGLMVMIYLFIFAVLLWFAYRQVWANVKH